MFLRWWRGLNLARSTKNWLIVLVIGLLLALIFGQKYLAATTGVGDNSNPLITDDLNTKLTSIGQQATGCGPNNTVVTTCSGLDVDKGFINNANKVDTAIEKKIFGLTNEAKSDCLAGYIANLISSNAKAANNWSATFGLANCQAEYLRSDPVFTVPQQFYVNLTIDLTLPAVDFTNTDVNDILNNNGIDKIQVTGKSHAEALATLFISLDLFPDPTNTPVLDWRGQADNLKNLTGNFAGPVIYEMNGREDLSGNFDSVAGKNPNLIIDKPNSYWEIKTQGSLNAELDIHWSGPNTDSVITTVDKANFCQTVCNLQTTESLKIHANKISQLDDPSSGTIDSAQEHKELYTGTGHIDVNTLAVGWNPDVKITKTDERSWNQDLQQDAPCPAKWTYSGQTKSTALLEPYRTGQTNYSLLTNYVNKNLVVDRALPIASTGIGLGGDQIPSCSDKKLLEAHIKDKNESEEKADNFTAIIKRSGSGNRSDEAIPAFYSGEYTTIDTAAPCPKVNSSEMCVKAASKNNQPLIGTWLSPFADSQNILTPYVKTYFPDFQVPGYFTIDQGEGKKTTLANQTTKLIPQTIVFTKSWNPNNLQDNADFSQDFDNWQTVIDQAKKLGADIKIYTTDSPQKLKTVLAGMGKGTWWVNVGHGSPIGLFAGDQEVPYSQIRQILHEKQIKLDLFAGTSCYLAHTSTPLAEVVIGSYGVGWTGENVGTFGVLQVGVGTHSFSDTTKDLARILEGALPGCSQR